MTKNIPSVMARAERRRLAKPLALLSAWFNLLQMRPEGRRNLEYYKLNVEFRLKEATLHAIVSPPSVRVNNGEVNNGKSKSALIVESDFETLDRLISGKSNFIDEWHADRIYLIGELPFRTWFSRLLRIGAEAETPGAHPTVESPSIARVPARHLQSLGVFRRNLIDGARNLLERSSVRAGQNVVLFCDYYFERTVIDAIVSAAQEREAVVSTVRCKELLPGGREEPPKPAAEAFKSADVLIDLFPHPLDHTRTAQEALFDWGIRYVLAPSLSEYSLSTKGARWPIPVFFALSRAFRAKLRSHRTCRITDRKGTDITCRIEPLLILGECEPLTRPGDIGLFPVGTVIIQPAETGDGVIVYDGYHSWGNTSEPVRMTFRNGWCTRISGGPEAKEIGKYIRGVENSRYFDEVSFGHNPKTEVDRRLHKGFDIATLCHSGVVHFGIGESKMDGGRYYSKSHLDGWIFEPTVYLDDEIIVENGRFKLLDDPIVRRAVRKFGEPEYLLRDVARR